jgi:hypothetical protein
MNGARWKIRPVWRRQRVELVQSELAIPVRFRRTMPLNG